MLVLFIDRAPAQCLSSVNPVGGSNNLLVLEKQSLRVITFYRYNYGNQYFEGDKRSDFNLIKNANYNYAGSIIGYGLANKITIETELGYFFNKTQNYNLEPAYTLRGSGFSNAILSFKYRLFKDDTKRFFISSSVGAKIPFSTNPIYREGVELPVEVQPTLGAFGTVVQLFLVKEKPVTGIRYFVTSRMELNSRNTQDYKPGTSIFTSFFFSKHLMFSWLKGDWTTILQIRNEIRNKDKTVNGWKESSGSTIFYFSPQINYAIKEKWNVSVMVDLPVYHYFNGTQLATKYGMSLNFARDFKL
ncbi:MAG: transporter [Bacteroidota bacterium]